MKLNRLILLTVTLAVVTGCNYAYPPAIQNGTDSAILIRGTLNRNRTYDVSLTPSNTFWTSKDRNTQVLSLEVTDPSTSITRRYAPARIEQQYNSKVMFLVQKDSVVVLNMNELPPKWHKMPMAELAKHGSDTLKSE